MVYSLLIYLTIALFDSNRGCALTAEGHTGFQICLRLHVKKQITHLGLMNFDFCYDMQMVIQQYE